MQIFPKKSKTRIKSIQYHILLKCKIRANIPRNIWIYFEEKWHKGVIDQEEGNADEDETRPICQFLKFICIMHHKIE